MFSSGSRREDNGENYKSSCILTVAFLLKLRSQWVKYELACVYIDIPMGEMKKKKKVKMSKFIHKLARDRTACFLSSVVLHGRGKLPKRKVTPSSGDDLFMYRT